MSKKSVIKVLNTWKITLKRININTLVKKWEGIEKHEKHGHNNETDTSFKCYCRNSSNAAVTDFTDNSINHQTMIAFQ